MQTVYGCISRCSSFVSIRSSILIFRKGISSWSTNPDASEFVMRMYTVCTLRLFLLCFPHPSYRLRSIRGMHARRRAARANQVQYTIAWIAASNSFTCMPLFDLTLCTVSVLMHMTAPLSSAFQELQFPWQNKSNQIIHTNIIYNNRKKFFFFLLLFFFGFLRGSEWNTSLRRVSRTRAGTHPSLVTTCSSLLPHRLTGSEERPWTWTATGGAWLSGVRCCHIFSCSPHPGPTHCCFIVSAWVWLRACVCGVAELL